MIYRIAIDGPSGAGKSTVARAVAKKMGIVYVDTGAMYRSIGLYVRRKNTAPDDAAAVEALLPEIKLDIRYDDEGQHILLCGEDVKDEIRTPEISMYASAVSAIPEVRKFLLNTQRDLGKTTSVVMDGRDIGTVIFPDAEVKIFLTASPEARAERRYLELQQKGVSTTYEEVLDDMKRRDANDSGRAIAPAIPAEDAVLVDSSDMTLDEVIAKITSIVDEKIGQEPSPVQPGTEKKKKKYKRRVNLYTVARFLLGRILRFFWRVKVHDMDRLPENDACVICPNHIAAKDMFILAAVFPRQIRFLAKAELFRIPVFRHILRFCGVTPIDRSGSDVGGLKKMVHLAEQGELIGIFPQGTRCPGKNPADTPVKNGAALIAAKGHAGMLAVCIKTPGCKYRFLRRKDVFIGEYHPYEELFREGTREEWNAATAKIFAEVCAMGGYEKSLPEATEQAK